MSVHAQSLLYDRLVVTDFDGTITREDSLKLLFSEALGDRWRRLEEDLEANRVSERKALQEAVSQMSWSLEKAIEFVLENVKVDPLFCHFYQWTLSERIPVLILSGGFREFIEPLLEREGLRALSIQANSVSVSDGKWSVRAASEYRLCSRMTHCKCASLQAWPAREVIYIGDGHTDFCPVEKVSHIYARASLQKYCEARSLAHQSFENFGSIQESIKNLKAIAQA
jgi:2,3-diketo-5-methylthio-1-phosphopentane phosphatase